MGAKIKENVDEMIDVLNNFMEPENRDDDVDQVITGLAQYFDDLFTNIEIKFYPWCTKFFSLNFLVK